MATRNLLFSAILSIACFFICCGNSETAFNTINTKSTQQANDSLIRPIGAIAYIRNSTEIRLIDSNGRNDRRLWTDSGIKESLGLYDIAWSPDGRELVFSSAHEALFSLYHADLYGIRPDGTGFRKITNAPSKRDFAKYKKGSVTLTVRNNQYTFQQSNASSGVFFVTIAGAEDPQMVTVAPGSSKTITFKSVADFGKKAQALVAISGNFRWFMPGTDVEAGKTNDEYKDVDLWIIRTDGTVDKLLVKNGLCPSWSK